MKEQADDREDPRMKSHLLTCLVRFLLSTKFRIKVELLLLRIILNMG